MSITEFQPRHIVCIGDLIIDSFIRGTVERISPEAPVPVLTGTSARLSLGGVGNVAKNLCDLGSKVTLMTVSGRDSGAFETLFAVPNLDPRILQDNTRCVTHKTRYTCGNAQLLRVDAEDTHAIDDHLQQQILALFRECIPRCDGVICSDYGKGMLARPLLEKIFAITAAAGKCVIVDPKSRDFSCYRGASVIKPNKKELHAATHLPVETEKEIEVAARTLLPFVSMGIFVTRGHQGMSWIGTSGEVHHVHGLPCEVFDVSGAGDTSIAVFTLALAHGATPAEAIQLANRAGSIVVTKSGTSSLLREELFMGSEARPHTKCLKQADMLEKLAYWRQHEHARIGFTNGCFDILHEGHVSLLYQAKTYCDRLVVGLNSDTSVSALKGPTRPLQDEKHRACVLSALEAVDIVVLFDELTPMELIQKIRPDVLIKGGNSYTPDMIIGGDFVRRYGGTVLCTPSFQDASLENFATTTFLDRVRKKLMPS